MNRRTLVASFAAAAATLPLKDAEIARADVPPDDEAPDAAWPAMNPEADPLELIHWIGRNASYSTGIVRDGALDFGNTPAMMPSDRVAGVSVTPAKGGVSLLGHFDCVLWGTWQQEVANYQEGDTVRVFFF